MKKYIHKSEDLVEVLGMANIVPKRSGLSVDIWSDHSGGKRKVSHSGRPRAKISYQGEEIAISIEENPVILAPKNTSIPKGLMKKFQEGMDYVGRNCDIFLKHYLDENDEFDDEDLFNALRERGEYR